MKIDFPSINAYGLSVRHLKWELIISSSYGDSDDPGKANIVAFTYLKDQVNYYGRIVDEEFEHGTTFKHILDVVEHRIFEMIGQNLEVPVLFVGQEVLRRI